MKTSERKLAGSAHYSRLVILQRRRGQLQVDVNTKMRRSINLLPAQEAAKEHDSCTNNLYNALKDLGLQLAEDPRYGCAD